MAQKILIADDEPDLLEILSYNLQNEGFEVLAVQDGKSAVSSMEHKPDAVILDVMMPEMDGYEACKAIRQQDSSVPIIFLTAKDSEFDEVLGLELGGDDYITKPFSPRTLIARIRAQLRKVKTDGADRQILSLGEMSLDLENYVVKLRDEPIEFTKTEFNLLAYLVLHPNIVHSREGLLSNVWGNDTYVVDRTVDVHIGKLRKKLMDYGLFIETKAGVGYRLNTRPIPNGN